MKYVILAIFWSSVSLANPIIERLQSRIEQAQSHLNVTQEAIADERKVISKKLNSIELEVIALRDKAVVAQRLADDKTLSLSKLEQRLESWQKQHVYQQNLINRFLREHNEDNLSTEIIKTTERLSNVINVAQRLQQGLHPSWAMNSVVMPSGEVDTIPTLSVGPVTWYWNEISDNAGLASVHDKSQGLLHSDLALSTSASSQIKVLRSQQLGEITFDPTLNRAMLKEQNTESMFQHVAKGGLWVIPIILFAVFALAIGLVKTVQLLRLTKFVRFTPGALANILQNPSKQYNVDVSDMQKALLDIARTTPSPRQRDDQLFIQLQDNKLWLERWIGGIAITAAISPLLGLLGTVSGMIETFNMMTLFGSGDPAVVSGGIAQALVTTELGLVVAIPALILNAILSRRAKSYYNDLESFAILLSKADEQNTTKPETVAQVKTISEQVPKNQSTNTSQQEAIA